jgi:ATP-dependent exoDNAse (exonuclease V) alpha subunit
MNLPKIEFQKVYRQTDEAFLSILDKMRSGDMKDADLKLLNEHVGSDSDSQDFSVTLSSFNMMAEKINEEKLNAIEEEEFCFQAEVEGNFKSGDVPVPEYLRLKVGAQVIFCRNNPDVGYMNGTIGKVSELNEDLIHVLLEDGSKIQVGVVTWQKTESVYNRNTRRMESEVVGSFTQFPLKLAWAITIHKSQGSGYNNILIILPTKEGHPLLNRQILYTAITRTKGDAYLLSNQKMLNFAKKTVLTRDTNIN